MDQTTCFQNIILLAKFHAIIVQCFIQGSGSGWTILGSRFGSDLRDKPDPEPNFENLDPDSTFKKNLDPTLENSPDPYPSQLLT